MIATHAPTPARSIHPERARAPRGSASPSQPVTDFEIAAAAEPDPQRHHKRSAHSAQRDLVPGLVSEAAFALQS